jgi:hypothetical protein
MAAYEPQHPASPRNNVLNSVEAALSAAFTVEIFLKLTAAPSLGGYFRNQWNLFDFVLVAAGYTAFMPGGESTSSFKVCRSFSYLDHSTYPHHSHVL